MRAISVRYRYYHAQYGHIGGARVRAFIVGMAAALSMAPQAAAAGPASDAVAHIYLKILGGESFPENRDRFTGPIKAYFDQNDTKYCIDFSLAVDGQDFDEEEIARTLRLEETVKGDKATVKAQFLLFEEPRTIEWKLRKAGGQWKIADVGSRENDWWAGGLKCEE